MSLDILFPNGRLFGVLVYINDPIQGFIPWDGGTTAPSTPKTMKSLSGSLTADTDLVAAVGGKRIKVCGYAFFTFGTSANVILLKSNGTGGTLLWTVALQSITGSAFGANLAVAQPSFLFGTAQGEKLTADVNTSDQIYWSINYFDDDAT